MNIILAGGATGGHIYPALAIADKFRKEYPKAKFLFLGAKKEIGSTIVQDNGYEIVHLNVRGFYRKKMYRNVSVVKDLLVTNAQIKKIFKEFKPDLVIGTGGYTCGPVIREAHKMGIATFLHEQNVLPGLANKMAQKSATKIYTGFKESKDHFKDKSKVKVVGNPIRNEFKIASQIDYRGNLGIRPEDKVIMLFGGSQGADTINEIGSKLVKKYADDSQMHIYFITGKRSYWDIFEEMDKEGLLTKPNIHVLEYADAIHELYAVADLLVSRSGAGTVSEIAYMAKPSILIPSPNVTANHQYYNGLPLYKAGGALLIEEKDLNVEDLIIEIDALIHNDTKLKEMSEAAHTVSYENATEDMYEDIKKTAGLSSEKK
ncbi:MAG: undecaprenyldiphospho-muramoylpentapeptide beta-N-acetylglucosaminyltransferase [Clostridiales Family XIII bacterium]|nr:undecaprenyldiphospho-muramoylpentapeptide beta-N-acetylglucosaminyltransferase [Clostridiales Family XIII bacterium]